MTYSCTTITLRLYDYRCYSCTTIALQLYDYRGYSRTTIDFSLIEKQVIWQMKCIIALFLSLDCIVINIKNPVISFYKTDWLNFREVVGLSVSAYQLVNACTTRVVRAHISCYASAQQLLCGLRSLLLRKPILSFPTTSSVFSDNFFRILRLYLTHYPLISYACVYLIMQ